MTLESAQSSLDDVAASGPSSTSTSSSDVYPLPFSFGQKKIVLNDEETTVELGDHNFLTPGTNVCVSGSSDVRIGDQTKIINSDVTIYLSGPNLPDIQGGTVEQYAVECNGSGQIVNSEKKSKTSNSIPKNLKQLLQSRPTPLWIATLLLALMSVISLIAYFSINFNFTHTPSPVPPSIGHTDDLGDGIQVIQRHEWLARPPLNVTKIAHPLKIARILHTGGSNCQEYQSCANKVLALQGWQVGTQGMPDLAYNYMIGGDGNVYVGRGHGVANQWMTNAIDIGYIGNFLGPYDKMTDKMDEAGRRLVDWLRKDGHLTPDYVVIAQNQTFNTQSPGENIYKKIVKWPHYDSGLYFD